MTRYVHSEEYCMARVVVVVVFWVNSWYNCGQLSLKVVSFDCNASVVVLDYSNYRHLIIKSL